VLLNVYVVIRNHNRALRVIAQSTLPRWFSEW